MTIHVRYPKGMFPRRDKDALEANQAQWAVNCEAHAESLNRIADDLAVPDSEGNAMFGVNNPRTIYQFQHDPAIWFEFAADVDIARGPVPGNNQGGNVSARTYLTGEHGNFANVPVFTGAGAATSAGYPAIKNYPNTVYPLSIPVPPLPPAAEKVPLPADAGTPEAATLESRAYLITYVRILDGIEEEGPPSGPSNVITEVAPTQSVTVSGLSPPGSVPDALSGANVTARKRLYRTNTSDTTTAWQYVTDLDFAVDSYVDDVPTAELGEVLATEGYGSAPDDMAGICFTANGIGAGFVNNVVCLSMPFQPHAWPVEFRKFTDDDVVAIAPTDTAIVVATRRDCHIITGNHPSSMSMRTLKIQQGCVSKRSMRSLGSHGVIYASAEGMVLITAGGSYDVITRHFHSPESWQRDIDPATIVGEVYNSRYYFSAAPGTDAPARNANIGLWYFDPLRPQDGLIGITFTDGNTPPGYLMPSALHHDEERGELYYAIGRHLYRFGGGGGFRAVEWESRPFRVPDSEPYSFIRFNGPPMTGNLIVENLDGTKTPIDLTDDVDEPGLRPKRIARTKKIRSVEVQLSDAHKFVTLTLARSLGEMGRHPY